MLVEHAYRATVVARDRVLCLKITRAAVHAQMLEDAALARHFERRITERLSRVADDLRQIDGILAACGSDAPQPADEIAAGGNRGFALRRATPRAGACRGADDGAEKKSAQPRGRSWAQEARHAQVPGGKPAPQAMSFG